MKHWLPEVVGREDFDWRVYAGDVARYMASALQVSM